MAPRPGGAAEDDGYVLTFVTNMNDDTSSCLVFAADDLTAGPIATIGLPQRICVGTHSYWEGKD
jgi:carotenoid cleavage dioxygenase